MPWAGGAKNTTAPSPVTLTERVGSFRSNNTRDPAKNRFRRVRMSRFPLRSKRILKLRRPNRDREETAGAESRPLGNTVDAFQTRRPIGPHLLKTIFSRPAGDQKKSGYSAFVWRQADAYRFVGFALMT